MLQLLRSGWDMTHPTTVWSFVAHGHTVVANFDEVNESADRTYLSGAAVDVYGWWHRRVVLDLSRVRGLCRHLGPLPAPEPEPFRVGVKFDAYRDSVRLTVPDDVARRLTAWRDGHWHEVPGVGDGWSDKAKPGTWEHRALAYVHAVQSRLHQTVSPFVEGESYSALSAGRWSDASALFVSLSGVTADGTNPTTGFRL